MEAFHDPCVWAKASDDSNYVQPSPPVLLRDLTGVGSPDSKRTTLFPLSPSALNSATKNEDPESNNPDYLPMDGSHLRKN